MSDLQINTRVRRLFNYLDDFEKGIIQIPPFQRDFVWSNDKKIELLDSLKNGYPIGTALFWQPNDAVKEDLIDEEIQTVGSYYLNNKNSNYYYILDGYQRLSTLFGCFIDINQTKLKRNEEEWKKKFDILYNLKEDKFESNRKTKTQTEIFQIPLHNFIDGEKFYDFQTQLLSAAINEEDKRIYIKRYKAFSSKISSYDLPSVDLIGGTIEEAVEIFSRLNSRGESISNDWKVSALSFDKERGFRFGSEIDKLFKNVAKYNFFTHDEDRKTKRELILQCVANSFGEVYFDQFSKSEYKKLEEFCKRKDFIDTTRKTITSIEKAIQFLFENILITDSRLMPYNNHLIFITDFFNNVEQPTQKQLDALKKWFWVTTYSNYFTTNLSKQRLAYKAFQKFIENENNSPIFYDYKEKMFLTLKIPNRIGMGSVRAKALALFMLQYQVRTEKLNNNFVKGYKTYKLFSNLKGDIYTTENTILVINDGTYPHLKSPKDLSDWLIADEDYNQFFITIDMKNAFKNGASKETVLNMRKKLIIAAEKTFVRNLGIEYTD